MQNIPFSFGNGRNVRMPRRNSTNTNPDNSKEQPFLREQPSGDPVSSYSADSEGVPETLAVSGNVEPGRKAPAEAEEPQITDAEEGEAKTTSIGLIWNHWLEEVDVWSDRLERQEDAWVRTVKRAAGHARRRRETFKDLANQIGKEISHWEKLVREEYLSATAAGRYFFPSESLKETNEKLDAIKDRVADRVCLPVRVYTRVADHATNRLVEWMERYVENRKEIRGTIVSSLKSAAKEMQQRQERAARTLQKQLRDLLFPIGKYMEQPEEEETRGGTP
jgi:hypothetical protein